MNHFYTYSYIYKTYRNLRSKIQTIWSLCFFFYCFYVTTLGKSLCGSSCFWAFKKSFCSFLVSIVMLSIRVLVLLFNSSWVLRSLVFAIASFTEESAVVTVCPWQNLVLWNQLRCWLEQLWCLLGHYQYEANLK